MARGQAYHLVKWDKLCLPKQKGGLGIHDLRKMNLSLLCKWWWKLEKEAGTWQDIVQGKYVKNRPICRFALTRRISNTCFSIAPWPSLYGVWWPWSWGHHVAQTHLNNSGCGCTGTYLLLGHLEMICTVSSFLIYWADLQQQGDREALIEGAEILKTTALHLHYTRVKPLQTTQGRYTDRQQRAPGCAFSSGRLSPS